MPAIGSTNTDHWKFEASVRKFVASPFNEEWLILLDHERGYDERIDNLLYVDAAGVERWRAQLPDGTGPDAFVDVLVFNGGAISAWTWSCYRLTLDARTGITISMEFAK